MKIAFIAFLVLITGTLGNTFYEAEPFLQSHHSVYDTKTDVLQFVEGFLNGVSSASAFAQIRNCIGDGAAFISEVSQAIEDIKSKNAARVKEGIELLGQAAQIIPAAAKACTASVDEVKDLVKLVESFQSPIQFLYYVGKSLIINHVDVLNEVSNAITAYEDKNWNQLGYWVGKAMDTIILGQPENIGDLKSDITAFAEGFVNGVASADLFSQIESCIQDTETFTTDVVAAVGDIKSKDPARVKTGILLLGQAASIIPNAATACKASAADVASFVKLVETFTSPSSFLYYIGKSLLINHVEVINEVEQIVSSFEASNYNQVGYWTGKTMDTIILGEPKEEFVFPADTKTDVLQFVEGFLNGVSSASAFAQIRNCIGDGAAFISEVSQAIEDIKSKNAAQVKEGIELLGQAAQIIPAAAKACTASVDEVKDLVKLVESFSSPIQFLYYVGKSLIINHVDVLNEVSNAITAYEDKNWNQLGYWVGKAMDTIILGQPKEEVVVVVDTKTDILNFVEGLLTGIGSASAFDQVRACVTDSEDIITDLANAVGDIKSKDPVRVKSGIVLIGQAAQIVPDAVQECKAGAVDLKTLLKMIESFQSPVSFLYYIGKSLLINHVEVLKEVENAVDGYFASNFTALGYWVGAAMDTIVLGQDQTLTQDFADFLNKKASWKAAVPSKFEGMTLREISSRYLGANLVDNTRFDNVTVYDYEGVTDVPASFNASEQWPGCIHPIRDQAQCGSCWAFAASEVLSDRFCIASNGSVNVILSPQYLLSCNNILDHGCNGGTPLFSWWFIGTDGLVTDSCLPYASGNGTNPIKCKDFTACADGTPLKKYYGKAPASLNNPASIQANLLQYGPVEAAMTVYQDFMYYTGGIYTHTSGSELGGHAIKITGWGNENGQNYWIVANSWGPTWGENGFFRIAWGQCGIDSACIAGQADLTKTMMSENKFW